MVSEGSRIAGLVRKALAEADFHLEGGISNSPQLLSSLGVDQSSGEETHMLGSPESEMVLGLCWNPKTDTLGFRVIDVEDVKYTRVGLMSKTASLFDLMGTAALLIIKAKIRLRALGTRGLNWQSEVSEEDRVWWRDWFGVLKQLKFVEVPRCLFPSEDDIVSVEMHIFCDASEEAYAAIVYTRCVYIGGEVRIRHVKATTKLAPLRTISIPKLELNAALIGARLARFVGAALTRTVSRRWLWTDSSTVQNWVRATAAMYQPFVSHRIGEIQTLTGPQEWRFVPGKLNPADVAIRSALEIEAIPPIGLDGPSYLYAPEEQWPNDLPWIAVSEEVRAVRAYHILTSAPIDWSAVSLGPDQLPILLKLKGEFLELIKRSQRESYADDLERLEAKKQLLSTSSLLSLTPFLCADGLLRLGSRTGRAPLPYDNFHPPILSGKHPLSRKIAEAFHINLKHSGIDFVFTHLRQHFWVKIQPQCIACRKNHARPLTQLMGDLPSVRLAAGVPPFTYPACDYFGPFETSSARNRVTKRWGALFTCLVTRSVYLDLATSLSSDDFLLVLQRFIGLYGKPKRLYSDNGTNFVGAERELREPVEELHSSENASKFLETQAIEWRFQPAKTPHFGGAHESLFFSTKRALYASLEAEKKKLRYPTDDILRTLLFEVADLLNSRPLTYASSDPKDLRPLTPNDFLNRPPGADLPLGEFEQSLPQERYHYVQRMTNMFWDIWKGPYLQSLVMRKKWQRPSRNLRVGDFVLEIDKDTKRGKWRCGRITQVYPGKDGLVRAVDVQFVDALITDRGITDLCLLEQDSTDEQLKEGSSASGENVPAN